VRVGIFYNSISNPGKFSNKVMLMDNFQQGVLANGDTVIEYRDNRLPDQKLDAGFVLGYTLEDNFRKKIIDVLRNNNTPQIFVDSNILHYSRKEHEWHRYSLNSVYPSNGVYFFNQLEKDKWETYSKWHDVKLIPWRTNGDHIIIFCQRPKGWNLFGNDQDLWLQKTIETIRKYSQRAIRVRMHPGDGDKNKQIEKLDKRYSKTISISQEENIRDALKNCWCGIGYNSTPTSVAAIEGIPVYVTDPVNSWASDIAFTDLAQIENPPLPDREEWINKIANIHWSNHEVKSGKLWAAIKAYISSAPR
jgi:hypothetical protein